jgi:hypothetical protein
MSAAGASAVAAMLNAVKAFGVVVRIAPPEFLALLERSDAPLVVVGRGGTFRKHHRYLSTYKGLAFFARSPLPLALPRHAEVITVQSISVPDF